MDQLPLISVIVPAHENEATIGVALDSLRAQSYANLEIIVVDDHSTDKTADVVRRHAAADARITYYALPHDDPKRINSRGRNVNAGYLARNFGLEKASGTWITFQDADDASLLNRIEVQYDLAIQNDVDHLCLQWQQLTHDRLGCSFDVSNALEQESALYTQPEEIVRLARKTQGIAMRFLGPLRKFVPFEVKRVRVINRLFFGSLASYPGTGNSPLFKKEIAAHIQFRQADERVWPSFTGRGADRDFNFQVALRGRSMTIALPLYLYRADRENDLSYDFAQYMRCP